MTLASSTNKTNGIKPIAITPGEPAGIGPELAILNAQNEQNIPSVILADRALIETRAQELALKIELIDWDGQYFAGSAAGTMVIHHMPLKAPCETGKLNPKNAKYVLDCLDHAIDGCLAGKFSALVTGPLHKGVINQAGIPFSGHTEHLQKRCKVNKVVMMLASPRMRVALATTHLPLLDVPNNITQESLSEIIEILSHDLHHKFGIERPRILVAGLNPHAGEDGHMGREEIDIIRPVLKRFKDQQVELIGPLPADTLFNKKYLHDADAVLAMYHDQGLPVLKFDGFGESVNITLGLPIIRTSVDHGTALDIAGSGQADIGSLKTAIQVAQQMAGASLPQTV
jgi:4-hydroxythreonine-4-phosphate dehydrogenase